MANIRTGRPIRELLLTLEEKSKLELETHRPKTDQRTALRTRSVLQCASAATHTAVAGQLGVTFQTVGKWRERFLGERLGALGGAPRSVVMCVDGKSQIRTLHRSPPALSMRPQQQHRPPGVPAPSGSPLQEGWEDRVCPSRRPLSCRPSRSIPDVQACTVRRAFSGRNRFSTNRRRSGLI